MLSAKEIQKLQEYLASKPVTRAFIFGSFARNEEQPESDIDIKIRSWFMKDPDGILFY